MRIVYASFIFLLAFMECSAQKRFPTHNGDPTYKCGGFTSTALNNKKLKDSVVIYGNIKTCVGNYDSPLSLVFIKNSYQKIIMRVTSDVKGYYKIKIVSGVYNISALQVGLGKIETGMLDYLPGDSVNLNLNLTAGEGTKN